MTESNTPPHVPTVADSPARSRNWIEAHLTAVATLNIAFGAVGVAIFGLPLLVVVGAGVGLVGMWNMPAVFGTTIAALALGMFVLLSLPGIIGGIGLLMRQEWARILLLVVAFIQLLNVPLGTALGIYTIWVLLQEEARAALAGSPRRA